MSDIILASTTNDQQIIEMWLHGRPVGTQKEYRRDVDVMLSFVDKPLQAITLQDLQNYADYLDSKDLKNSTKRRRLNSVKSLLTFTTELNYTRFNVGGALRMPKGSSILAGRIMRQGEVYKLLDSLAPGRDRALMKLLYGCGLRISEALGLNWDSFSERDDGEIQVAVLGKGEKYRVVIVPVQVWLDVQRIRSEAAADSPVFISCRGKRLERSMAHRIIKSAVEVAGLDPKISNHWLRHAHAQHALSKGAPIHLVRDTLGHSSIAVTNFYLESNPRDSSSKYLNL